VDRSKRKKAVLLYPALLPSAQGLASQVTAIVGGMATTKSTNDTIKFLIGEILEDPTAKASADPKLSNVRIHPTARLIVSGSSYRLPSSQ
jgi:hypothetical protein